MRIGQIATLAALLLALLAATAVAGDYHVGPTLKCYQCHMTHGGRTRPYADDPKDAVPSGPTTTGTGHLLNHADINVICLGCHDGGEAIDVYGSAEQGTQPAHRSAGSFNANTTGAYSPFSSDCGHDLGSAEQNPSEGEGAELTCVTCHDPHGNDYYRNLRDLGSGGITYAKVTNDTGTDVFELKPFPLNSVAEAHEASNISYNAPEGHRLEAFCSSCHADQHAAKESGNGWLSHPTTGHARPYTTGTLSALKTIGGTPIAGETGPLVAGELTCLTCHKAHGSNRPFGLIYDNRTTPEIEDGEGLNVSATCKHCHDQGLTAAE